MIRVRQVKVSILKDTKEELIKKVLSKLKVNEEIKNIEIVKKSIDARDKENIYYVYEVDIDIDSKNIKFNNDVFITLKEEYKYTKTGTNNE